MLCDKNQFKLSHPIFYMPSIHTSYSLWGQRAVCTWTEWTPFPRMLDSHLQSACWGKLLSCTCRWPEERTHLVRSAVPSSSTELHRAWRDTGAGRLATPQLACTTVHILQAAAHTLYLQTVMGASLLVVSNYRPISMLPATVEVIQKVVAEQVMEHLRFKSCFIINLFWFQKEEFYWISLLLLPGGKWL